MKIIATNLGSTTTFDLNGKTHRTGIFKFPVSDPLYLGKEGVTGDTVANLKVHGGVDKACYLFAADQYPYWKARYPELSWEWGMFGENLTIEGLNEATLRIGNTYRIGNAVIEISQPREPCFKLGYRFKDQGIIQDFIAHGFSGSYARVLQEGTVVVGDHFELFNESENSLTVKQFYDFIFTKEKDQETLALALSNAALPAYKRARLQQLIS